MKRTLSIVVAILLGFTVSVAIASPAQAAWSACVRPPDKLCTWQGPSGSGNMYYYTSVTSLQYCVDWGFPFDNNVESAWNRFSNRSISFDLLHSCASSAADRADQTLNHDVLADFGPGLDNKVSSVMICAVGDYNGC